MRGNYRRGLAAILSCALLAACDLPHQDRAAPVATLAPKRTIDVAKVEKALHVCDGTFSSIKEMMTAEALRLRQRADEAEDALRTNRVVQAVMQAIQRRKAIALRAVVRDTDDGRIAQEIAARNLYQDIGAAPSEAPSAQKSKLMAALDRLIQKRHDRLTMQDFRELYDALRETRVGQIGERIVRYEADYLNGKFVDRFGHKWPAPKPSWTVSDEQITESLTVLLEAMADEIFTRTPVWYEDPKAPKPAAAQPAAAAAAEKGDGRTFYPGGNTDKPTFLSLVSAAEAESLQVKMDTMDGAEICGMTKLKMDALIFLSNKASTLAAGQSGLLLGGFGGTNVGLPFVMGKLSIGDNQTLQAMFKALVAYIAKRGTYEASWHLLLHVNEKGLTKVGQMASKVVLKPGDDDDKDDKTEKPRN